MTMGYALSASMPETHTGINLQDALISSRDPLMAFRRRKTIQPIVVQTLNWHVNFLDWQRLSCFGHTVI